MVNSQTITKAIHKLEQSGLDSIVVARTLIDFAKKHSLTPLLPNVLGRLAKIEKQRQENDSLQVFTPEKSDLSPTIVENIRQKLLATEGQSDIVQDETLMAGFVAKYKNITFDASIKNQIKKLEQAFKL